MMALFVHANISIHALREEGDPGGGGTMTQWSISIHALREEGDFRSLGTVDVAFISIHALREEGDTITTASRRRTVFLSTPSARRATRRGRKQPQRGAISIHALREEGDVLRQAA